MISIETAENPTQLTIRYRPNFTDIVNNNFFESYHFVYNASKVSWINSSDNGYPSVINKTISGLKPYTYYCVRMAASSFKSSGFFTGAKCAWTAESGWFISISIQFIYQSLSCIYILTHSYLSYIKVQSSYIYSQGIMNKEYMNIYVITLGSHAFSSCAVLVFFSYFILAALT